MTEEMDRTERGKETRDLSLRRRNMERNLHVSVSEKERVPEGVRCEFENDSRRSEVEMKGGRERVWSHRSYYVMN